MGVYCLKASINLSKKAARLSFGSCLIKFTLDKFVGFLEAAWRLPGGQPSESGGTLGDTPYLQCIQKSQFGPIKGNPSSIRWGCVVGLLSTAGTCFCASDRIRSLSSCLIHSSLSSGVSLLLNTFSENPSLVTSKETPPRLG